MIINSADAERRINNPLNLMMKIKSGELGRSARKSPMDLFIKPSDNNDQLESHEDTKEIHPEEAIAVIPSFSSPFGDSPAEDSSGISIDQPIKADDLLLDADVDIELAKAHNKALSLMGTAMRTLENKLDGVKADKLPTVITSLGKVVSDIRRERVEREKANERPGANVHYHFYCPTQRKVDEYEVIEVAS